MPATPPPFRVHEPETAGPIVVEVPHASLVVDELAARFTRVPERALATDADVAGPKSAEFRLAPGELRASAQSLRIAYSYEGLVVDPDGRSVALTQLIGSTA